MAEVTAFRHNALPYPVYGLPWAVVFPMLDADGDLVTGATTPDAEVSKNGDTFADCTNESTEIATNSGMWYLLLTGTEMSADIVAVIAKSATAGMKTTPIVLYPRKLVTLRTGTVGANAGDGTTIQLDSSAVAVDDYYNGCVISAVIDSTTEVRMIGDYAGSTKVCTVLGPAFITAADNNDTFTVYLPESRQVSESNNVAILGTATSTPATAGILDVNVKNIDNDAASASGTVTFPNATLASTTNITAGTITTVTTTTTATNVTTVNGLAAAVITAASIAANAINDSKIDSDVGAGLTSIPWNAAWDAEVQSEVADEIVLNNLDHLCKVAVADAQAMAEVVDNTIIGNILSKSSSTTTYDPTTDSLEALRDNTGTAGAGLTAADDAVITLIGVAGAGLTNINLPDQTMDIIGNITGNLSGSVGSVTGAVGSVAAGGITSASLAANAITAAKLDPDVTTEVQAGLATQTSVDDLPTNAELATAIDPLPTAAENAAALMDLANGVETGLTPRQAFKLIAAASAGKLSGAATTTVVIRNAIADDKDRITATVDADGNRSGIVVDLT